MTKEDGSQEEALIPVASGNALGVEPSRGHSDTRSQFREYGVGVLKGAIGGRFETAAYQVVEPTELGAAFFEWISSIDDIEDVKTASP